MICQSKPKGDLGCLPRNPPLSLRCLVVILDFGDAGSIMCYLWPFAVDRASSALTHLISRDWMDSGILPVGHFCCGSILFTEANLMETLANE
jgi:hypothetical protein